MGIIDISRIGKVINHSIEKFIELVVETRKDFNQKAFLYNSSGEDSPPVKNDRIALLKIDGTGKYVVAGVLTESQGAKPGEKIFFSRNADGELQSIIKMLEDGTIDRAIKKDSITKIEGKETIDIEGDLTLTVKGTIKRTGKGDIKEEATGEYSIKAQSIKITGTTEIILSTIGSAAWFPNCIPTCPFGMPHGGQPGGITGLKGA
ncbi:hypothetical protein FACS189447_07880 [Spirochaetia bacterium]|nr:hypothetical protein FACS189447_07880 [Spirochaetia bacterium]